MLPRERWKPLALLPVLFGGVRLLVPGRGCDAS